MLDNYQTFSDTSCFTEEIERVEFEVIGGPVDDHPAINGLNSSNRGKRIYPDKETVSDSTDRTKVRVKATVTPATAGVRLYFKTFDLDDPSTNDSPVDPNGSNGDDNKGNVGGSKAGQLSNCSVVSGTDSTACYKTTDSSGVAFVDLKVTKNPGDNFAVAVSKNWNAYLRRVAVNGISLKNGAQTVPVFNPSSPPPPTSPLNPAMRTELLTVWRRLHLEVDSMGIVTGNSANGTFTTSQTIAAAGNTTLALTVSTALEPNRFENGRLEIGSNSFTVVDHTATAPPNVTTITTANTGTSVTVSNSTGMPFAVSAGQGFVLYDDDDFNDDDGTLFDGDSGPGENVATPDLSILQSSDTPCTNTFNTNNCNVLAHAYVMPIYDLAGSGDDIPFELHVDDSALSGIYNNATFFDSRGSHSSIDFWTVYVLGAYQYTLVEDSDPDEFGATYGVADGLLNGQGFAVFIELNRPREFMDLSRYPAGNWQVRPVANRFTTAHELGHLFNGLHTDTVSGNAGIMMPSVSRTQPLFNLVTLNKIRGGTGITNP